MGVLGISVGKAPFLMTCVIAGATVAFVIAWLTCMENASTVWTAVGAVGTMLAAFGAVYAARKALEAAQIPITAQEEARVVRCRSIAPAIGYELRRASEEIFDLINELNGAATNNTPRPLSDFLAAGFLARTTMLEKFVDKFDVFGHEDGATLTRATASILNLRTRTRDWREFSLLELLQRRMTNAEIETIRKLDAEARMTKSQIDRLKAILENYGGGKTEFEV